ncbi:MAG: glycosyltransferase family 4 protein [Dehalococcoidia bacterium]|nr:glycosyltransferase family 4 protein [Dehalococcoidia bacterium]
MRICFLLHQGNMYSGGQGVYLAEMCREYVELGHEVHVVVGPPYPELDARVVQHRLPDYSVFTAFDEGAAFWNKGVASYFQPLNFYELATSRAGMFSVMSAFSLRAFEVVARLHARRPFDLVHDNQSLGYGDLLVRLLGVPVVANIHHPLAIDRANAVAQARTLCDKIGRVLFYPFHMQHVVAHRIDRVVTGSRASGDAVRRAFRLGEAKVAAIHDGVDTSVFHPLGMDREQGRVLFVGNSDDRNKGARYLVEALGLMRDRDWQLVVVDRAEAQVVRTRARELGIEGRVSLTGRLSKGALVEEYNRAAVFVSPSLYEGFGLPAAEAQACGAPVVAAEAGALPEVVADGVSGLLVPPGNPRALAEAMRRVMDDGALAGRLGAAGVERIRSEFTWRRTAERTLALYEEVLAGRR